ncbi:MAG: dUTP diphosphatase [Arsenophonus sp.]|nr:MAG: dUTP diphosphatase [Arsenophonus sp.]
MKKNINVKILDKKIGDTITFPHYGTEGSAGLDLRACLKNPVELKPNKKKLVSTGLAIHIADKNLAGLILPRSGLSHHYGIFLGNTIGLIDSDYQGELIISLFNQSKKIFFIQPNERIAQIIFISIIHPKFNFVKNFLIHTKRNTQGFGHTGKI